MSTLRIPVSEQDHSTGNPGSGNILVEYGDYQCPNCGRAFPLVKKLLKEFPGEFGFVFRNFPLQESHPLAMTAALAAEAAALQGKFWEMHDIIYENQETLSTENILDFAGKLGLNEEQFANDIRSKEIMQKVENDFLSGVRSGVNGTPSFFYNGKLVDSYNETYESLADLLA